MLSSKNTPNKLGDLQVLPQTTLLKSPLPPQTQKPLLQPLLQEIIADELEKQGLNGINEYFLKSLPIWSLSTRLSIESQSNSVLMDLVKWQQLGSGISPLFWSMVQTLWHGCLLFTA